MLLENPYILVKNRKKLIRHTLIWAALAFFAALVSVFALDEKLSKFFGHPMNEHLWIMAREVTNIGLGEHYFIFCAAVLIFVYYIQPRIVAADTLERKFVTRHPQLMTYLKIWAWNFLAALLTAGISLRLLKFLFGRQRPHVSEAIDPHVFHFFHNHWDFQSMPSGHTQVLFTVATLLMIWDPKKNHFIMWSWAWLTLAAVFSFTRVMTLDHFLSDVIVGSAVGYLGALWGLHLMYKYSRHKLI